MRYIGSKGSTVELVYNIVSKIIPEGTICDPFGGISIVGSYFKQKGYAVYTSDNLLFAHYFQISKTVLNQPVTFDKIKTAYGINNIETFLNSLEENEGWFIENYSSKRLFFTTRNAKRIQACWNMIRHFEKEDLMTYNEKAVLLSSLINSMDKISNTAGTYYAYLKNVYRKANRCFKFQLIHPVIGNKTCFSYYGDALDSSRAKEYDILYLDPPYNGRNYSRYYHLPETIAKCEEYNLRGKSGMPDRCFIGSEFYQSDRALVYLETMIKSSKFKLLVLHYHDNGLITPDNVKKLLKEFNKFDEIIINSKGYTKDKGNRYSKHHLYLVN